jgi:hypothetical protein
MGRVLGVSALVVVCVAALAALVGPPASATLDDDVYTSRDQDVRMVTPRGWRVSESPAYPGVLLWMNRTKPPGQMLLTVDDVGPEAQVCWPKTCPHEATVRAFLCVLQGRLTDAGFQVGPVEDGRWFDYQDGKPARRFLRQGVIVLGHRAFTLILATPASTDRVAHARAFDRALRTIRSLDTEREAAAAIDAGAPAGDAGTARDGGAPTDAGAPTDTVPPCRAP